MHDRSYTLCGVMKEWFVFKSNELKRKVNTIFNNDFSKYF